MKTRPSASPFFAVLATVLIAILSSLFLVDAAAEAAPVPTHRLETPMSHQAPVPWYQAFLAQLVAASAPVAPRARRLVVLY
jgi:hypothetical protein